MGIWKGIVWFFTKDHLGELQVRGDELWVGTGGSEFAPIPWDSIDRVEIWMFYAWMHEISLRIYYGDDRLASILESHDRYHEVAAAVRRHLRPIDEEAWNLVECSFEEIDRTVYQRPTVGTTA